jgi:hypothetical protein
MGKCVRTSINKKKSTIKKCHQRRRHVVVVDQYDLDLAKVRVNNDVACAQDNA